MGQFRTASFGSTQLGLTTVAYTIYDNKNVLKTARTTTGITEQGGGIYSANITLDSDFQGLIYWDNGIPPQSLVTAPFDKTPFIPQVIYTEPVDTGGFIPHCLVANFGSANASLTTVGYQLFDMNGTSQGARATAGVSNLLGGYYGVSVNIPTMFVGYIVWNDTNTGLYYAEALNYKGDEYAEGFGRSVVVSFGTGKAALSTIQYQLRDNAGESIGSSVVPTVITIGGGYYALYVPFPRMFNGSIAFDSGDGSPVRLSVAINHKPIIGYAESYDGSGYTDTLLDSVSAWGKASNMMSLFLNRLNSPTLTAGEKNYFTQMHSRNFRNIAADAGKVSFNIHTVLPILATINAGNIPAQVSMYPSGKLLIVDTSVTAPTAPNTLSFALTSQTVLTLSWVDASTNEANFIVERSLDNIFFTQVALLAAGTTSYADSGLTANTLYYYRVRSQNSAGASSFLTGSATTLPNPPTAPSVMTINLSTPHQITVGWTDNSNNETGFEVWRSPDGTTYTLLHTTAANAVTYTDSGLTTGNHWWYEVRAVNTGGNSAFASSVNGIVG